MNFAQCISEFSGEYGLITSLFLAGLVGGAAHCSGMCAPFVLAQSGTYKEQTTLSRIGGIMLAPYHLGRMTTYVSLAILFHSVLNLALLFGDFKIILSAFILLSAAVIFAANVFPALGQIFPKLAQIRLPVNLSWINALASPLMKEAGTFKRYSLGVLLGFMPCGMVVAAIMAASTATNTLQAALAMSAFSLGTMPALVLVAAGGHVLQIHFPRARVWVKGLAGAFSVVWLCFLATQAMAQ